MELTEIEFILQKITLANKKHKMLINTHAYITAINKKISQEVHKFTKKMYSR